MTATFPDGTSVEEWNARVLARWESSPVLAEMKRENIALREAEAEYWAEERAQEAIRATWLEHCFAKDDEWIAAGMLPGTEPDYGPEPEGLRPIATVAARFDAIMIAGGFGSDPFVQAADVQPDLSALLDDSNEYERQHQAKVREEVERIRVREDAMREHRAAKASALEIPAARALDDFLSHDFGSTAFAIEGCHVEGGRTMIGAARKTGKTHLVGNLIRSLADGEPFLDAFAVPVSMRVALLDNEMGEGQLQTWVREQAIRNTANVVDVTCLRGRLGVFDIRDDKVRAGWARRLSDAGTEAFVFDVLGPLIVSMGLKESTEAGEVLQAFDELKVEAGIRNLFLVHHFGHGEEARFRGDSRIEGWPESLWFLTRDSTAADAFRFFHTDGRDTVQPRGLLSLNGRRLSYTPEAAAAMRGRVLDSLLAKMSGRGEMSTAEVVDLGVRGIDKNSAARVLREGVEAGSLLLRTEGPAKFYRAAN